MSINEEKLLESLRNGDKEVLGTLFSHHRPRLWRMVKLRLDHRLSGRVDPEDILQEAYLAAAKRIPHYFKESWQSFFVWLREILLQTLIDTHRQHLDAHIRDVRKQVPFQNFAGSLSTDSASSLEVIADLSSPSEVAIQGETATKLNKVLHEMDWLDREVLILRHFEELTNREVAEVLHMQPKATSIRYMRALEKLRENLSVFPDFQE